LKEGIPQGLIEIRKLWRDIDEHERLAVATETPLQQVRQLGVTVRYVLVLVGQGTDHVAQGRERLVDGHRLLQAVAGAAAVGESLAAGEIDQVQKTARHGAGDRVLAIDLELEHAVTA